VRHSVFRGLRTRASEENFAAHDFDGVAADTNVNYTVIMARGAHENLLG